MKQNIPCEMIQDLLPLYVDGLTSEETNRKISEHLEACAACREQYKRMKREMDGEKSQPGAGGDREIDYLKKVKKRGHRKVLLGVAATLAVVLLAVFFKLFIIGFPVDSYIVTYTSINDGKVQFGGAFYGSAECFSRYRLADQGDGTSKLVVYGCLPSAWNRDGVFNLETELPEEGQVLDIGGILILSDGTVVGKLANDLYGAKNPYVGDASADGRLAQTLGIARELGNFKNQLQTSEQPYGWTLHFEDGVSNSAVFEERMKGYACVLIALTDNLGEVGWTYTVETESGPVKRERGITEAECTQLLGAPVKSFGEDARNVQNLLDLLEIQR